MNKISGVNAGQLYGCAPLTPEFLVTYTPGRHWVKKCGVDTHGERAECEPITEVWGGAPGQGVRGRKPPAEAESLLRIGHPKDCILLLDSNETGSLIVTNVISYLYTTEDSFIIGVACGKKWRGGSEA